jgi:general secretion pathway protein B
VSFILDALRKSEHERQRSSVPGLSHVPLTTPAHELPRWAVAVIGLLAVAVVALGVAWLAGRRPPPPNLAATPGAASPSVPLPLDPTPPIRNPPPVRADPGDSGDSLAAAIPNDAGPRPATRTPAPVADAPASAPAPLAAAPSVAQAPQASAPASSEATLPSAAALAAEGIGVPPLKLELHAYSDRPAERYVFVNGRKYAEGDTLADGPKVVTIEPNGVVLSQLGHRFLLTPE